MKMTLKNMPKLHLSALLRRRKMTLKQLMDELGMTTYESLVIHCRRIGVVPPDDVTFRAQFSQEHVNNPQEGVLVLEAPVDDRPSVDVTRPAPAFMHLDEPEQPEPQLEVPPVTQKKQRKKKDESSIEQFVNYRDDTGEGEVSGH